ncbi:MAG: F0F1 ATP synthase subunit delta [Bacteroidales bacterium]|jgi:F-type H+-transporting ATPase subunit delta|nr:F0F1 ATP synthase subunit delta [Bacteroidales bacterium]MCI2122239.1 F0F1 ATP synthase subunit delta [Bacteroidales bacterium]MCI2144799.1 F0F1 ATP synthase subunit delta [Bacteroidales bacterium]
MDVNILSMRYAKALFQFAAENGDEKKVYEECQILSMAFPEVKKLRVTLQSPLVSEEEKTLLIREACSPGGKDVSPSFNSFIKLVIRNKREGYVNSIILIYMDLYRNSKHIGVAKLTTAVPVEKHVLERISEKTRLHLHAAEMEFDTKVDPRIEGGFIFDFNDFRIDASVYSQLLNIRKQLTDRNRRIV